MSKNYNKTGTISVEDSDLRKSISEVLAEDAKQEQALNEAAYQKAKTKKQMTFTESCRLVAETAATDSLARYPGDNANSFPTYPKPDIGNVDKYFGDVPGQTPKQKANVDNTSDSQTVQRQLVDAT